ncbi:kelch-like protein 26 [Plakobranchus ocellatus]|uniref:Kelch-like protein 26 n=1 Tax=Plakobranchus ocellatus TaxID=259542 RepID=A0AAV4DX42_9GAST|nr:kelch-like protein 26 [Plakobranchus ocellatus]
MEQKVDMYYKLCESDFICVYENCREDPPLIHVNVQVHRALLAATSDYFRVMFKGLMAESKQDTVDLKGVSADGLQQIIEFIYSGEMTLSGENLTEVINTASHLQVSSAIDVCSSYIKSLLTFESYKDLLSIADTYSLDSVLQHWDSMIQERFMEFSGTQAFLKMEGEKVAHHIAQDTLRLPSEYQLFVNLDKWFRYQPSRIAQDSAAILGNVRFGLMSEQELNEVRESPVIKQCPIGQQLVSKGFHYHLDCRKGHPTIDDSCKVRADKPAIIMVHVGTSQLPFLITAFNHETKAFYNLYGDVNGIRECRLAAVDNFAYICRVVDFGGGSLMSSLFRFDPRHLVGQELLPMRRLRSEFSFVAHQRRLYAFGGTTETFAILDSVECYDVATNTWEELPALPSPTHSMAAVSHGTRIFLSGGVSGADRQIVSSFSSYDPSARRYEARPSMFYPRRLHDMIAQGSKIFALGGITRQDIPLYGQTPIESFDLSSNQWTILSSTLGGRSVGHYLLLDKGRSSLPVEASSSTSGVPSTSERRESAGGSGEGTSSGSSSAVGAASTSAVAAESGQDTEETSILSLGHEHHSATEEEMWLYQPASDSWSKYARAPQRMSLNSALGTQLLINFGQDKVASKIIKDK